jgi:hypothetical protein
MASSAEFAILQFERAGHLSPLAVLLLDPDADRLFVRVREDLRSIADPDDAEVLRLTLAELAAVTTNGSGGAILRELEDTLSNAIRISDRGSVPVHGQLGDLLERLYSQYVAPRA